MRACARDITMSHVPRRYIQLKIWAYIVDYAQTGVLFSVKLCYIIIKLCKKTRKPLLCQLIWGVPIRICHKLHFYAMPLKFTEENSEYFLMFAKLVFAFKILSKFPNDIKLTNTLLINQHFWDCLKDVYSLLYRTHPSLRAVLWPCYVIT